MQQMLETPNNPPAGHSDASAPRWKGGDDRTVTLVKYIPVTGTKWSAYTRTCLSAFKERCPRCATLGVSSLCRTRAGSRGTERSEPELVRSSVIHEEGLSLPLQHPCEQTLSCSTQGEAKQAAGRATTIPLLPNVMSQALETLRLASRGGHSIKPACRWEILCPPIQTVALLAKSRCVPGELLWRGMCFQARLAWQTQTCLRGQVSGARHGKRGKTYVYWMLACWR